MANNIDPEESDNVGALPSQAPQVQRPAWRTVGSMVSEDGFVTASPASPKIRGGVDSNNGISKSFDNSDGGQSLFRARSDLDSESHFPSGSPFNVSVVSKGNSELLPSPHMWNRHTPDRFPASAQSSKEGVWLASRSGSQFGEQGFDLEEWKKNLPGEFRENVMSMHNNSSGSSQQPGGAAAKITMAIPHAARGPAQDEGRGEDEQVEPVDCDLFCMKSSMLGRRFNGELTREEIKFRNQRWLLLVYETFEHIDFLSDSMLVLRIMFDNHGTDMLFFSAAVCWMLSIGGHVARPYLFTNDIDPSRYRVMLPIHCMWEYRHLSNDETIQVSAIYNSYIILMRFVEDIPQIAISIMFTLQAGWTFWGMVVLIYSSVLTLGTAVHMCISYPFVRQNTIKIASCID